MNLHSRLSAVIRLLRCAWRARRTPPTAPAVAPSTAHALRAGHAASAPGTQQALQTQGRDAPGRGDFSLSRFHPPEVSEGDPLTYFELMRAWQDTLVEEVEEEEEQAPEWHPTLPMSLPTGSFVS